MFLSSNLQATEKAPSSATRTRLSADRGAFARIGIVNDHLRVSYANGSSFASQFLHREFARRGHQVTLLGPSDPSARQSELPPDHIALWSRELHNHPGVYIPFPNASALREAAHKRFDVLLGQTASGMLALGTWLRARHRVPYLCVNTFHVPSAYNVMLPDSLLASRWVRRWFDERVIPLVERSTVQAYNASDGLIVLSEGLKRYWEKRGVSVPIFTIPRSIEPRIFDARTTHDPFDPLASRGGRLLVVCRHTREKGLERLIRLFAAHVAPRHPTATLTLVGDGPDHDSFRQLSERLGVAARVFFPGERPLLGMPDYYRCADLFLYTSLSDTYGQVVTEAAWCGLPCVALEDGMGVSQQVVHAETGLLVESSSDAAATDARFAGHVLELLRGADHRRRMGRAAAAYARARAAPDRCIERYYAAFAEARRHLGESPQGAAAPQPPQLWRWMLLHGALVALGYLRRRVVVNRNASVHPGWTELLDGALPRGLETAPLASVPKTT